MLNRHIRDLIQYGLDTGLIPACEKNYTINLLLDLFQEEEYEEPTDTEVCTDLETILKKSSGRSSKEKYH